MTHTISSFQRISPISLNSAEQKIRLAALSLLILLVAICSPGVDSAPTPAEPIYVTFAFMGPQGFANEASQVVGRETMLEHDWNVREKALVASIKREFGPQAAGKQRYIGFCVSLLPTLNLTPEQLKAQINLALDLAEQNSLPVFFHLDDEHFWWRSQESHNSEMVEWSDFPKPGEKHGPVVPRYWLNWGEPVEVIPAPPPCFACPAFRAAFASRLKNYVAAPIVERLNLWRKTGKEYLFAGLASGNETRVPDFRNGYEGYVSRADGVDGIDRTKQPEIKMRMKPEDRVPTGYHSLYAMGYNQQSIERLAHSRSKTVPKVINQLFYDVAHDYAEFQTKTLNESGLPKDRLYTHFTSTGRSTWHGGEDTPLATGRAGSNNFPPPFESAVNRYSRPGFTVVRDGVDLNEMSVQLRKAHAANDGKAWAVVESYACTSQPGRAQTQTEYEEYLGGLIAHGAKLVDVYGWDIDRGPYNVAGTGVLPAVKKWLSGAQLSTSWYRSEAKAAQAAMVNARLEKIQETARDLQKRGVDPLKIQPILESFPKEIDPLAKSGRIDEVLKILDRTITQLQGLIR